MKGLWGGYKIVSEKANGLIYEIETVQGVKGINIPVSIEYLSNNKWTVTDEKENIIEIKKVFVVLWEGKDNENRN